MGTGRVYPAVPGPHDRVHFFDQQRHHRQVGRWYGALSVVAVLAAGVPLSLVVTPLAVLLTAIVFRAAQLAGGEPGPIPGANLVVTAARGVIKSVGEGRLPPVDPALAAVMILPGALVMIALWLVVRKLLTKHRIGDPAIGPGTRDVVATDLEEHQLRNLVEEMAIAGGTPVPRLRLIDGSAANAAALGTTPADATLVVSRALLDRLDRDETQAVVGHLVASVGNGDLELALRLLSVQQALGLLTAVLDAPFGPRARRILGQLLLSAIGSPRANPAELTQSLTLSAAGEAEDLAGYLARVSHGPAGALRLVLRIPLLPFFFIAATARITAIMMTWAVFGPAFAAVWRRRRRLADAWRCSLPGTPTRWPVRSSAWRAPSIIWPEQSVRR
jgi:Zn-dependent protease with chaperone function